MFSNNMGNMNQSNEPRLQLSNFAQPMQQTNRAPMDMLLQLGRQSSTSSRLTVPRGTKLRFYNITEDEHTPIGFLYTNPMITLAALRDLIVSEGIFSKEQLFKFNDNDGKMI